MNNDLTKVKEAISNSKDLRLLGLFDVLAKDILVDDRSSLDAVKVAFATSEGSFSFKIFSAILELSLHTKEGHNNGFHIIVDPIPPTKDDGRLLGASVVQPSRVVLGDGSPFAGLVSLDPSSGKVRVQIWRLSP